MKNFFRTYKNDIPAGLVVYLVALPLCLGIALASGAPLFAGVITGIIGGIVVGFLSDSRLSVSGPAAGLTVIVFAAIATLGSFEAFLLAVFISGAIQLVLGYAKAGVIGHFFPSSVITGMLTAIGLSIILKQIPHAFGYDLAGIDTAAFEDKYGHNTFSELYYMIEAVLPGAVIISVVSMAI
ncbi:MAG: SulP family inorganic anion transporter, partial [Bacteroidales bacterium]|nr:SulP family inorganic anion transporter [Bacteroidales bacterium]